VQEFQEAAGTLAAVPWATYDFNTMYEALDHKKLLEGVMHAVAEAWMYEHRSLAKGKGARADEIEVVLAEAGWYDKAELAAYTEAQYFTPERLRQTLEFMLGHLYVLNGTKLRQQEKGVPMGLECAPQLANLYGYSVESQWVQDTSPSNVMHRRFIDDIFVAGEHALEPGRGIPSEEAYGMKYKSTGETPDSLIYLGVRLFKDKRGQAHTTLHDRAVDYPITIQRYPEVTTVANPSQLGGVIMGRLVAAQRACSCLDLFQDAVAGILTHAHMRGYSRRMLHSV
jgi:hypothetical protein